MKTPAWIALRACLLLCAISQVPASNPNAGGPGANSVVAVIEPTTAAASGGPAFSVSVGGQKLTDGLEILNALGQAHGSRLVMLVHESVSIGAVLGLAASASKAGYRDYSVYVFDRERHSMASVPGFKSRQFSMDVTE